MRQAIVCIVLTTLAAAGCATKPGPAGESPEIPRDTPTASRHETPADSAFETDPEASRPERRPAVEAAPARLDKPVAPSGTHHRLERGMTLAALSRKHRVPVETLMRVNGISDPTSIPAGTKIFVPGSGEAAPQPAAKPSAAAPAPAPRGARFVWPLKGRVTSPFGPSPKRAHHAGIDIDGEAGDEIRAAADGEILKIAENPRYGLMVVVQHRGGYETWYGHASDLFVRKGDNVKSGDVIALVGESGNARGSHLHFEVRRNGRPMNPLPHMGARDVTGAARK